VSDWQPIATAPKDGTPILACFEGYEVDATYNLHPSSHPITVYWGTYHPNSPGKNGWRDGNGHLRPYMTHWMPVPPPPKPLVLA